MDINTLNSKPEIKLRAFISVREQCGFTGYEFELAEGSLELYDDITVGIFRLDSNKDGTREIFAANSEDYGVHEDLTSLFDVDFIHNQCIHQMFASTEAEVYDATNDYLKFVEWEEAQ